MLHKIPWLGDIGADAWRRIITQSTPRRQTRSRQLGRYVGAQVLNDELH